MNQTIGKIFEIKLFLKQEMSFSNRNKSINNCLSFNNLFHKTIKIKSDNFWKKISFLSFSNRNVERPKSLNSMTSRKHFLGWSSTWKLYRLEKSWCRKASFKSVICSVGSFFCLFVFSQSFSFACIISHTGSSSKIEENLV